MPRANTKAELLEYGAKEFQKLMALVDKFSTDEQESVEVFEGRTIKDLLAHLDDWLTLVFNWEQAGQGGAKVAIPGPGYTWKDAPAFNEMLYQKSRERTLAEVNQSLQANHAEAMRRISNYQPEDLEAKGRLPWTGSTSIASYYASCTSSHYVWASGLLKKAIKSK